MVTKTKALETLPSSLDPSLEQAFSEGLARFHAGEFSAAADIFGSVRARIVNQDNLGFSYVVQRYLAAIQDRLKVCNDPCNETLEMSAQLFLNEKKSLAAMEVIDRAISESSQRAVLYYLKAIAYAQLEQDQESAAALMRALELDPNFIFLFRLESDFDSVRNTDAFLELASD